MYATIGHTVFRSLLVFNYFRRGMSSMGNAFVACEVVYCIGSYRIQSPHYHQLCIRHQDWKMVEPQYSVHQSLRLQLHGGQQPQRKSTLGLGRQAFGHLSHHV